MPLHQSTVPKSLDKKLTLCGYELAEILLIFTVLAVLNLLFGRTSDALFLTWLPPLALAIGLRVGKKDRPENYFLHFIRFRFSPGVYSAFQDACYKSFPLIKHLGRKENINDRATKKKLIM